MAQLLFRTGIVMDNEDPNKIGRLRVRIFDSQGPETTKEQCEWFYPIILGGSGFQYGSLIIPEINTLMVCAIQEVDQGEPFRWWLGGYGYGVGSDKVKTIGNKQTTPNTIETPPECINDYPKTKLLYKTLQGSSIYINGTDDIFIKHNNNANVELSNNININKIKDGKSSNIILNENNIYINHNTKQINIDENKITIQNNNTIITIENGKVTISGDNAITINASKGLTINGPTKIDNTLSVSGTTTLEGITWKSHKHNYYDSDTGEGAGGSSTRTSQGPQ